MHLFNGCVFCCVTSLVGLRVPSVRGQVPEKRSLESFYIVTHVVSDASPFRYEYVLDVEPKGEDVLVREIRIGPLKECPGVTVKAAEHLISHSTAQKIARFKLCSLEPSRVASAIADAQPNGVASIDDTASYTIVAKCGKREKVFEIPYHEQVDFKKLKNTNPQVASLWNLDFSVLQRTFGKHLSFYDISKSEDDALQALGAELVPAISSGIYKPGFASGSHLETLLKDYAGPVAEIDPWTVEFLASKPAGLLEYRLPNYPALARQARIQGEVRLSVLVDPITGIPSEVTATSGNPLLTDAAVKAVKGWRFRSGLEHKEPLEVALRFVSRCTSD